jgi:hypothetical protein
MSGKSLNLERGVSSLRRPRRASVSERVKADLAVVKAGAVASDLERLPPMVDAVGVTPSE